MKHILIYTLLATLTMPMMVKADDITLPVIAKPAALEEGIQRELTSSQIAELLPWAKDSKLFLTDLLETVNGLSTTDKIESLMNGIQQTVGESAPKNSELLMRYALNRAIVLSNLIDKEMDADAVGTADAKVRVLTQSIKMALRYYDMDMDVLAKKTKAPFKTFGVDYFLFLTDLNKSVFDASAQYNIHRTALEWLQWDLYRDNMNVSFAPQIVKINNSLKMFPVKKMSDATSIAMIRQMKKVTIGMTFDGKVIAQPAKSETDNTVIFSNEETTETKKGGLFGGLFGGGGNSERNNTDTNVTIVPGDRVQWSAYVGTVLEVYANGTIKIDTDNYSADDIVSVGRVGKGVRCFNKVCARDRVQWSAYTGSVKEVFTNGVAYIDTDNYSAHDMKSVSELGVGIPKMGCKERVCAGDRVQWSAYIGTVKEAFTNGILKIDTDNYSADDLKQVSQVGKGLNCVKSLCAGARVQWSAYTGTVKEVFDNEIALIDTDNYSADDLRSLSQLGY